jgi:hypothetical protein
MDGFMIDPSKVSAIICVLEPPTVNDKILFTFNFFKLRF